MTEIPAAFSHVPRRVLLTADTVGGVWTYAVDLCRALGEAGIEIILATMGAPVSPEQLGEVKPLGHVRLMESTFRLEWMENCRSDLRAAGRWLLALEERFSPDVIHLNGYAHAALPWNTPVVVVAHSCVLSWWQAVKRQPAPSRWNAYAEQTRRGLLAADAIVSPTRAMMDALQRHYGLLSTAKTQVIANGRDPGLFRPGKKELMILNVGRLWDEAKNADALAAVAPRLPWRVWMVGNPTGPDGGQVRLENVHALGPCGPDLLRRLYTRAAIYAAPARYEPFGLSALEAGMSGCALVLGDIPSQREVWGDAAHFVDPDDPETLHAVLQELIDQPQRRQAFAQQAHCRSRQFTSRRMAESYLALYHDLLQAPAPALPRACKFA